MHDFMSCDSHTVGSFVSTTRPARRNRRLLHLITSMHLPRPHFFFADPRRRLTYAFHMCSGSGQQLIHTLLAGVGHAVARAHVPALANVLWALQQHASQFSAWLLAVLGQDEFPTSRVTMQAREALAGQLLRGSINKKDFAEAVSDLSVVARGLC